VGWLVVGLCLALFPGVAHAGTLTLSLNNTSLLVFPSADPGSVSSIPAVQNPVHITVTDPSNANWVLYVVATGDLTSASGLSTIALDAVQNNLTWTVQSGAAFSAGTVVKNTQEQVGTGSTSADGYLNFLLRNDWAYAASSYRCYLNYMLVAP
jgi:hypothetical protein